MESSDVKCEIWQKEQLYNCRVFIGEEFKDDVALGNIRCDKIRISYNTNRKKFLIRFVFGGMRLVESYVDKIFIYELEKENNITFPDIDAEWPYENMHVEMKED
jgi:hypothetical protein